MAYIYNVQSAGDRGLASKINALADASGKITDISLSPEIPASYVVFKQGSLYYYRNGTTGITSTGNADASTIIQAALDALTAGRTWKEKVALKGTFDLSSQIELRDYTFLDLSVAKLVVEAGIQMIT